METGEKRGLKEHIRRVLGLQGKKAKKSGAKRGE